MAWKSPAASGEGLRGDSGKDAFHRVPLLAGSFSSDAVERLLTSSVALRVESAEGKQIFYRTFTRV